MLHGDQLDLHNEDTLKEGMKGIDRKMIEQVEDLAAGRSFFYWQLEFPEVFFGLRRGTERGIEHKAADQAGFDAVESQARLHLESGFQPDLNSRLGKTIELCRMIRDGWRPGLNDM